MHSSCSTRHRVSSLHPLTLAIATCCVVGVASATTQLHYAVGVEPPTIDVMSCEDAGAGSLREAIAGAGDPATIDLTSSGCSEITLTTGEIHVIQSDLSIVGPGSGDLTIKGGASLGYRNRIFDHSHAGTLTINGLTLADAHLVGDGSHPASGGCVYSFGTVALVNAVVTGCEAEAPANSAVPLWARNIFARRRRDRRWFGSRQLSRVCGVPGQRRWHIYVG